VWSGLLLLVLHYLVDTFPNIDNKDFGRLELGEKGCGDQIDH
jgi:hypothetical protein